jgi:hypothetical protein
MLVAKGSSSRWRSFPAASQGERKVPLFYEDSLGAKLAERFNGLGSADDVLIEDPEALAAAEAQAAHTDPTADHPEVAEWVAVWGPQKLSDFNSVASVTALNLTAPLDAAEIPCRWEPYPPSEMPSFRVEYGVVDRPFTLLVPVDRQADALDLIGSSSPVASIADCDLDATVVNGQGFWATVWENRHPFRLAVFAWWFVLPAAVILAYQLYHYLRHGHF